MKRLGSIILVTLYIQIVYSQANNHNTCYKKNSFHEITSLTADDFNDLKFLKKKIGNKRIVLLGESSHTIAEYYKLKTRLVKFLHKECGFEIFAMESGFADIYTIHRNIDSLSDKQLMDKTLYANLSCNEMLPLFTYLKENKELTYCGFDSQNFGKSLSLMKKLLHDFYGYKTDSLVKNLEKYYQIPNLLWQADKTPLIKLTDTIKSSVDELIVLFKNVQTPLIEKYQLSETHIKILERSLYNHKEAVNLNWETDNSMEKRDSLMAENVIWIANELFPNKKIIIWAHNTHIDRGGTNAINKSMGYYINKKMPNETYHIGLYAQKGELYWWWTQQINTYNNDQANDIETFANKYPITFFDTKMNSKKCSSASFMGFEAEFGRKLEFSPSHRYDAIINFRTGSASTYSN